MDLMLSGNDDFFGLHNENYEFDCGDVNFDDNPFFEQHQHFLVPPPELVAKPSDSTIHQEKVVLYVENNTFVDGEPLNVTGCVMLAETEKFLQARYVAS